MATSSQNRIHNSAFNFEYADRATASRCSILIESIFYIHILPELEKAISNQIPEGMLVELAKLEINIGKINENDLATNLASRIRQSFEEALQLGLNPYKSSLTGNTSSDIQILGNYLISSIEVFLQKGYLPFGFEPSTAIDDLVARAMEQNKKEFILMIVKYGCYEPAIRRMAYNLNTETFDLILAALNPVNSKWIIEFRQILSYASKGKNLGRFTGNEFLQTINYFILNNLLNETGLVFDKKKFSASLLKEFLRINPDFHRLTDSVKKYTGQTTAIILINETLAELMAKGKNPQTDGKAMELDLTRLIDILNSSGNESKSINRQLLKDQFIRAINNQGKRRLLIERLNKTAINLIIGLFYSGDPKTLASDLKTVRSEAFDQFVQSKKDIDLKRVHALFADTQPYSEISGLQELKKESPEQEKTKRIEHYPDSVSSEEYFSIYSRKAIGYYLEYGQLPIVYFNLNHGDIQTLFGDLIQQKDDFLVRQFQNNSDPERLIQRIKSLIADLSDDSLKEYFIHFFHEEYVLFTKVIAKVKQHFTFKTDSRINSREFGHELFMTVLAKTKGGDSSGFFLFTLLQQLHNKLGNEVAGPENLLQYLFSESGFVTDMDAAKNKINSNTGLKHAIESDLKLLLNRIRFTDAETLAFTSEIQGLIKNFAFYFHADQQAFQEIFQKNRDSLLRVYPLLKFYLPQNQWEPIEKSFLSTTGFKEDIELFHRQSDQVFEKIQKSEMNLFQTFESFSPSESQKIRTFLMLIMSDKTLFDQFISQTDEYQLPARLKFSDRKIQAYIQQLMYFAPGSISDRIDRRFWKSTVLSFGIRIFLNEKKTGLSTFAGEFRNHLLQKLKLINETELFYLILDKMSASGLKGLQELVEHRYIPKVENPQLTSSETDNRDSSDEIHRSFTILQFYAQNGFFPWWAGNLTLPEIIRTLNQTSRLLPNTFEETFLRLEKEEQLFERLIQKMPESSVSEFNQLISAHSPLKVIWKDILLKVKRRDLNDNNLKYKELYFSGNEAILNQWQNQDQQIISQIKEHLLLSPYFNFRSINSDQWRQMVNEFSLEYYGTEIKKQPGEFHSEFLKYLIRSHSNINWPDTLSTVYQHVKSLNNNTTFPSGLIQLIHVETGNQANNKMPELDENKLLFQDDDGVEVKVYNAGLILFWPFLTRLFEHLSLLKNGAFINHESMNRAVYILQYLGYNDIDFPEYKLVLNKLLVGMQSEDHLVPIVALTDDEKESAQSLLKGLINNWEKVKNSSPEGIQETFLQREGILRFQTDKVTLVVEKKGVDILLESIQWNISLIKLAWMKVPLYVEWI
jgi:hypothetical protein